MGQDSKKPRNPVVSRRDRFVDPRTLQGHCPSSASSKTRRSRWTQSFNAVHGNATAVGCSAAEARRCAHRSSAGGRHHSLSEPWNASLDNVDEDVRASTMRGKDTYVRTAVSEKVLCRTPTSRKISVVSPTRIVHREEDQPAIDDADLPRILVDGFVLANRYIIMSDRKCVGERMCRLANDRLTGQRVFLKFYSRFSTICHQTAKMHKLLQNSSTVCELIDILPNSNGLPPCLVFQAGSYTLEQKLEKRPLSSTEQQDVVGSIAQMLCDLHGRQVVHGHVDPRHIMWFSTDFCWKFVDFDTASVVGEPVSIQHMTSCRYTAPEIQQALAQNSKEIFAETSSDMWSFGLIAFQILTSISVHDAAFVKETIARERRSIEGAFENDVALDFGVDQRFSKSGEQRLLEFDFVMDFLAESPAQRKNASQAIEDIRSQNVSKNKSPLKTLEEYFRGRGTLPSRDFGLGKWAVCHAALSHLSLSTTVERFTRDGDAMEAFYERRKAKAKQFFDNRLSTDPVSVLTVGKAFRVHISIRRDSQLRFPFEAMVSVNVIPPDGTGQLVQIWERNNKGHTLDALAFVEPSRFESKALNMPSPIFGPVHTRYVKLELRVTFRLGDGFPHDIDMFPIIYLQLKRRSKSLELFKRLKICRGAAMDSSACIKIM